MRTYTNTVVYMYLHIYTDIPPVIDKGSFVPRPSFVTRGNKRVKIGTPVYVHDGYVVRIDCNTVRGRDPIYYLWYRNGIAISIIHNGMIPNTLTITGASNGDLYNCRAESWVSSDLFDSAMTTIYIAYG